MSNAPKPNTERPLDPPRDQAEADSLRRAECAERISRLLSALDGGTSPGRTEYLTKNFVRKVKSNPDSDTSTRFLLIDKNGPIGEFGSWEDASQYRNDLHHHGARIIGAEQKPLEPGAVREQPTNQPINPEATQPAIPAALPASPEAAKPTKPDATEPAAITVASDSPNRGVVQELKKADDPGESRPNSLPQSGALPANSTVMRIVGKIFPSAAKTATLNACPQILINRYELLVLGNSDAQITNVVGVGNLTLTCAPPTPNYETINIHYTSEPTKSPNRA